MKDEKVPLTVRFPESIHRGLIELTGKHQASLNDVIIRACREFIEREQGQMYIGDIATALRVAGVDEATIERAIAALKR